MVKCGGVSIDRIGARLDLGSFFSNFSKLNQAS